MITDLLAYMASLVISVIEATGYFGIVFFMAIESANIPVPSEVIMPFSGYLVAQGELSLFWVALWGAVGNLVGSLVSYGVGYYGGRAFLEKYGKFFFVHMKDLELADRWFAKYGSSIAFFSRMLPVVRTFVSLPAGIARMNIWKFSIYTFIGSFIWSLGLVYIGVITGENWHMLEGIFRKLDWVILLLIIAGAVYWVYRHKSFGSNPKA